MKCPECGAIIEGASYDHDPSCSEFPVTPGSPDWPMSESYGELHAALRFTSPSAIYDLRRIAIEKAKGLPWWQQYPEGQMAAAFTRILRIIGPSPDGWHNVPWESEGMELPVDHKAGNQP